MDDPAIPAEMHAHALRALRRIHWISGTARSLWRRLRPIATSLGRPARVLDLACGRGDLIEGLDRLARQAGCELQLAGCDVSAAALELARRHLDEAGVEAQLVRLDLTADPLPRGHDVVVTSLFLHHLSDQQIVSLFGRIAEAAGHLIASDLVRSRWGAAVTWVGTRTLTRCPVVHVDGMKSVRAALTPRELHELAERAGLRGATVSRCWPARQILQWSADRGVPR